MRSVLILLCLVPFSAGRRERSLTPRQRERAGRLVVKPENVRTSTNSDCGQGPRYTGTPSDHNKLTATHRYTTYRRRFDDAAVAVSLFHTASKNKHTAGTDGTTTVRLSGGFTTTVSARGARLSKSCSGLRGMSSATS